MLTFRPDGDDAWTAALTGDLALAMPASGDVAAAALAAARRATTAAEVLDTLLAGGLAAAPHFVLLVREPEPVAGVRVLVRGDAVLRTSEPAGAVEISGRGVSTWVERLLQPRDGISVTVPGGTFEYRSDGDAGRADGAPAASAASPPTASLPTASPPTASGAASGDAVPDSDPEATILPSELLGGRGADADDAQPAGPAAAATTAAAATVPEDSDALPVDSDGYSHLFGATVFRDIADAAVRPAEEDQADGPASAPATPAPAGDGDHDGQTVFTSSLPARRSRPEAGDAAPERPAEAQHAIELPDGRRELIDRSLILGRSPSATRVSGSDVPRLITIGTSDGDISRNHVRVAVEGGTVVVTDLHSRNGTHLRLPGKPAQRLRPGEPAVAITGTVVDLGGGVEVVVVGDES